MKKVYLILLVICSVIHANAQWKIIDTIDYANFINVHFWDTSTGIISGEIQGRFLKTHNGGNSWDTIDAPILKRTVDYLTDMQFVDDKMGFVCGGSGFSQYPQMFIGTRDGGDTWDSLVFNPGGGDEFMGLDFTIHNSQVKGIVFGRASIFSTLDSGKSLTPVKMPQGQLPPPIPNSNPLVADAVLWHNTIIMIGQYFPDTYTQIFTSANWGQSWTLAHTDTNHIVALGVSGDTVFAGCTNGTVLRSTNGGASWTSKKIGSDTTVFRKIKFGPNGTVYMLSYYDVYASSDNGQNWKATRVDEPYNVLFDISMPAKETGYIVSNRRVYKITNGQDLLSVRDLSNGSDGIKIYPNPTSNKLHIQSTAGNHIEHVRVYSVTGQLVATEGKNCNEINVSAFAKGMYTIDISTQTKRVLKKIIIE